MPFFLRILMVMTLLSIVPPTTAVAQQASSQDVDIELEQFGVGSIYRPGDVATIRVRLTNNDTEARQAWVQWEVPNADGDIGEYGRVVTLPRGGSTSAWLYAPLNPDPEALWTVRVLDMVDGTTRGELGGAKISPDSASAGAAQLVPPSTGMIAYIGASRLGRAGLGSYQYIDANSLRPIGPHEATRLAGVTSIGQFPDRWFGWSPFEAVVWGNYDQLEPADLSPDQADAVREYVLRGGHLVIILPQRLNPWGIGITDNARTELSDLLPTLPVQDDEVLIEDLLPAMSKATRTSEPLGLFEIKHFGTVRSYDAFNRDNFYEPLIVLPDDRVIAVQRIYGHGHVTVIGVDVSSRQLGATPYPNGMSGLPQADVFWNRVFGRRADVPSPTEIAAIQAADMLNTSRQTQAHAMGRGALFTEQIGMDKQGAIGLLLALILFALYWLAAGPVGHVVLKQYKAVRHAWVGFAACAGVFTAVAWGAVSLLPGVDYQISHVTYLDHIARPDRDQGRPEPQNQRAASWFSVYLKDYGKTDVTIDEPANARNMLRSWTAPGVEQSRFPNVDRYPIDVGRNPGDVAYPSRSTATQLKANWWGPVDTTWGGMIREESGDPVRTQQAAAVPGVGKRIIGSLRHDLPGDLVDASIIWVTGRRLDRPRYAESGRDGMLPWVPSLDSGQVLNRAFFVRLNQPWAPAQTLRLDQVFPERDLNRKLYFKDNVEQRYTTPYEDEFMTGFGQGAIAMRDRRNFMEMLSMFQMLQPPKYLLDQAAGTGDPIVAFNREEGRELDLSAWFNRPCLIIMGYLEDVEIPIPLRIAGSNNAPTSNGRVMVRWIMPLPLDTDLTFPPPIEGDDVP